MKKTYFIIILSLFAIAFVPSFHLTHPKAPLPQYTSDSIKVGEINRAFNYYIPKNVGKNPHLIFAIHGSGATGEEMQFITGRIFDRLAEKRGNMIIVYPTGYHKFWNDCRKMATYEAKVKNIDDIDFFKAMIHFFATKYNVDTTHVFATGMSNGGQMCIKLAMEMPEYFKGIAPVAASLPVKGNDDCYPSNNPVSMLFMNGTADPINPYKGGEVVVADGNKRGAVYSTDKTIEYWLKLDGCKASARDTFVYPDINKQDSSVAINYTYENKANGKKVVLVKVVNGGHIYPNPVYIFWPKVLGKVNGDINAPEIIYDFFEGLK